MRIRRSFKRLLAWVVVAATLIVTAPTIWHDAIANAQTYLHTSRTMAMVIAAVPIGLIVLLVALIRVWNRVRVHRQHRAVHEDALRNLRL